MAPLRIIEFKRHRFEATARVIDTLPCKSVLRSGFAPVRDANDVPVHAAAVKTGQAVEIEFAHGKVQAREDSGPKQGSWF